MVIYIIRRCWKTAERSGFRQSECRLAGAGAASAFGTIRVALIYELVD